MIISEVNAVFDLVLKATSFYTQFQDAWYKGSSELDAFEDKVLMLSAKHSQWSEQLQRYGISEDKHLLLLVNLANQALEKQQEKMRKLQRSPFRRWKKRVFPRELSYIFDKVLQIVDAGPQLLATKADNNDLLERYMAQNPTPLPFGRDTNYVPIVGTILKVRSALENAEEPRIVTVYGGPGMGKSCLAKHLAIHYQEERQSLEMGTTPETSAAFPNGVSYHFCGRHADKRVKQLQLELLQSLGFETGYASPDIDSATTSGVQADYTPLPSHQMKLRTRLAKQKLLVILDDLWEEKVLQGVLVPAKGVKYLVTSQMRDIFITAKKIRIDSPTKGEARNIMANYTDGLPIRGQFPLHIQRVTDDIIETLQHHPLSLANIGISINSSRVTDPRQWEVIRKNLYLHLDENDLHRPPAYDRPYSLPVRASMMLMVESLPSEAQRLLFLMALLGGQSLPETLVKYFYTFIQADSFALKYNSQEKFLEDRSLIEILSVEGNRSRLDCHSLRSHYIRDKKRQEVRSLGSQILIASGPNEEDIPEHIQKGDTEQTLVAILGAIYYHQDFTDITRSTLEKHIEVLNDGAVIPRSLNMCKDALDVVNSARQYKHKVEELSWLLKADHEEVDWKNQAHEHAKKIIIKFVCQGKLDDDSMASLLKHPQTTSVACAALDAMSYCHRRDYYEQKISFSSAYIEIMQTLLALVHNNGISAERRARVMRSLFDILRYESEDTILEVAAQYKALLAMESRPNFRVAMMYVLQNARRWRGVRILEECPGLVEDLMEFLLFGKDHKVRLSAARTINTICEWQKTRVRQRVADFPNALQQLLELFMSEDMFVADDELQKYAGNILSRVSMVPETRIKFREIRGIWEGLRAILGNLERAWRETRENNHREKLERRACAAALILGYLGLEEELRDTISSLPGVREGLLFLQLTEIFRSYSSHAMWMTYHYWSTMALTVLSCNLNPTEPNLTTLPSLEKVLTLLAEFDQGPELKAMGSSVSDTCCVGIYWARVLAYTELRAYVEALSNLDLVQRQFDLINTKLGQGEIYWHSKGEILWHFNGGVSLRNSYLKLQVGPEFWHESDKVDGRTLRECRVFLQAMQGDYAEAFRSASAAYSFNGTWGLIQFGVLKRLSGDLQGALDDLNAVAMDPSPYRSFSVAYRSFSVLKHRGYVKYLMGDEAGAREDAESAQQMERQFEYFIYTNFWELETLPMSYLGFYF